jgi:hypothetical protein
MPRVGTSKVLKTKPFPASPHHRRRHRGRHGRGGRRRRTPPSWRTPHRRPSPPTPPPLRRGRSAPSAPADGRGPWSRTRSTWPPPPRRLILSLPAPATPLSCLLLAVAPAVFDSLFAPRLLPVMCHFAARPPPRPQRAEERTGRWRRRR